MTEISVIIPTYNSEKTIYRAIDSVLRQTYPREKYEIIVMDDCSTDRTEAICRSFDDIKFFRNKKNLGIGRNRCEGLKKAKSKYVCFLSADDAYEPTYLSTMIEEAENHPDKILYSGIILCDENMNPIQTIIPTNFNNSYEDFVIHSWELSLRDSMDCNFSSTFFPRKVFEKIDFSDIRFGEDLLFLLKSMKLFRYYLVPQALVRVSYHSQSETTKKFHLIPRNNEKIRKEALRFWREKREREREEKEKEEKGKFTVDYYRMEEIKGGVQTFLSQFREMGFRNISYSDAANTLSIPVQSEWGHGFEFFASIILDRYLKQYEKFFDIDIIIKNSIVGTFNKYRQICVLNDNVFDNDILRRRNFYDVPLWFKLRHGLLTLQKQTIEKSDICVAVSRYISHIYKKRLGIETTIIEHGVDVNKFSPGNGLREMYGLPHKPIGLFVGSFHPIKGFHYISQLCNDFQDIYWLLVFKHQVDYKPKLPNVRIYQNLPQDTLVNLYRCSDFYVNPSSTESFGLTTLESMSCNTPVIAQNTGFLWEPETKRDWDLTEYGIRVNIWSYEAYYEAVKEILKNTFEPRRYVLRRKLDLANWKRKWKSLLSKF
ncbi:MAG: glycosyltransferase [Candidatus Syntropharchaeia archaeon]